MEKNLPSSTLENLAAGMNHAEIGALIAEKWNFPEELISAIRYHHDPDLAPTNHKDLVDVVYLASMLCEYEASNVTIDQFDSVVLENYGITTKKQIDTLLDHLALGFVRENRRI